MPVATTGHGCGIARQACWKASPRRSATASSACRSISNTRRPLATVAAGSAERGQQIRPCGRHAAEVEWTHILLESPLDADTIRNLIETGLPGARADVQGDDGVHFEATVVSEAFAGKLPLARHRMVYATLGDLMGGAIHALALKTVTPAEAG